MNTELSQQFLVQLSNDDFDMDAFSQNYQEAHQFLKLVHALKVTKLSDIDDLTIRHFLEVMKIPKAQWGRYLGANLTVFEVINTLSENNQISYEKLHLISAWIQRKNGFIYFKLIALGLFAVTFGILPWLFSLGISGTSYLISSIGLIPASGIVSAVFAFFATLFPASFTVFELPQEEKSSSFYVRFKQNFFSLLRFLFNGLAYGFVLAAVTTNPVIGGLFVVAAFAEVIQQAVNWLRHPVSKSEVCPIQSIDNLYEQETHDRKRFDYKYKRNEILINLAQALLLTAIVAVWCFVPGGLIVSVVSIAAMGVVMLLKNRADTANDTWEKAILNRKFEEAEQRYELAHPLDLTPDTTPLQQEKKGLLQDDPHYPSPLFQLKTEPQFCVDKDPEPTNGLQKR